MAFFDCSGIRLLLGEPEEEERDPPGSIIYFRVDDIHQELETLQARGADIIADPKLVAEMPDHDLWMAFFKDSEGNTLAIMSEVPRTDRQQSAAS